MMIILDHYNGNDNENGNDNSDEEKKETRYMRNKGGLKKKIKKMVENIYHQENQQY